MYISHLPHLQHPLDYKVHFQNSQREWKCIWNSGILSLSKSQEI